MNALSIADEQRALGGQSSDPQFHPLGDVRLAPPGPADEQLPFVLVGEQIFRTVDEGPTLIAVEPRKLLRRISDKRDTQLSGLGGVVEHGLRIIGAHQDETDPAVGGNRCERDVPCLAHRSWVKRRELALVVVGGAGETRGVCGATDKQSCAVDPVAFQPGTIIIEILADRAHQYRVLA